MNAVEEVVQAIGERYERLPIELLIESPFNPRKTFDAAKLQELGIDVAAILEKHQPKAAAAAPAKPKKGRAA